MFSEYLKRVPIIDCVYLYHSDVLYISGASVEELPSYYRAIIYNNHRLVQERPTKA
jgi:hypothetical protein